MISSIKHKQSISWTFLNDAMAISTKEMPKNHTNKERFAAALSCIQTGILTLLFPRKGQSSSPSPFISHCVLEAVASWIFKSLFNKTDLRKTHRYFNRFPMRNLHRKEILPVLGSKDSELFWELRHFKNGPWLNGRIYRSQHVCIRSLIHLVC